MGHRINDRWIVEGMQMAGDRENMEGEQREPRRENGRNTEAEL